MAEIIKPIQQIVQKVVSWFIDIPEIPDTPEVEEIRGTLINKSSNNAQIPVVSLLELSNVDIFLP